MGVEMEEAAKALAGKRFARATLWLVHDKERGVYACHVPALGVHAVNHSTPRNAVKAVAEKLKRVKKEAVQRFLEEQGVDGNGRVC